MYLLLFYSFALSLIHISFREATQPMIEAYEEQYPGVKTLLDTIDAARGEE